MKLSLLLNSALCLSLGALSFLTVPTVAQARGLWLPNAMIAAAAPKAGLKFEEILVAQNVRAGSNETFQQHVFFSSSYASGPSAPVLYYISGESSLDQGTLQAVLGKRAQILGAYVVGVEHRFYGKSAPVRPNGFTVDDLLGLTVENELADLALIERQLIAQKNLQGPWFSIGGSYAGTLSAYYRAQYPDLVRGSLAFSPPLLTTPQGLTQYEAVAENAQGKTLNDKLRVAIAYLIDQAQTVTGRTWLSEQLKLPNTNFDGDDIASMMVTEVPEFSQYGKIQALASVLADGQSPEAAGTALAKMIVQTMGACGGGEAAYCIRNDAGFNDSGYYALWTYEAFSQFGWLYVSNPDLTNTLVPGHPVPMSYYQKQYDAAFQGSVHLLSNGFAASMLPKIENDATHIVFINGTIDPWISISLPNLADPVRELLSLIVQGGSHCPDFGGEVSATENAILDQIRKWSH